MNERETDVVILGAGTAGLNARREVEKAGKRWLLVDPGPYGTTCARVGCMPSKLLIAAAEAAHDAHRAGLFGIDVQGVRVDGRAVMARVRRERDRFAGFVVRDTEAIPPSLRPRARGRILAPDLVELDTGERLRTGAIVVATGSTPWIPPGYEAVADRLIVNDHVFDWDDLPRSVAVVGAGVIGLELGQALHRLGVEVVILDPFDRVVALADDDVNAVARATFADELDLHLGAVLEAAVPDGSGAHLTWTTDGVRHERRVEQVLVTAGRRPNLTGLGLESLGVELTRGLPPFDPTTMQVADLPVFLAGDVNGDRPLLHEAADEGRIAGANAAAWPDITAGHRRVPMAVAFTDPQVATIGPRVNPADTEHLVVGEVSYDDQGRSRVIGRNRGIARVYADRRTTKLVGATLFGPHMEHVAHLVAWAVQSELTVDQALSMPFYHPVVEEGLRTALRDLAAKLDLVRRSPPEDCADCPGA